MLSGYRPNITDSSELFPEPFLLAYCFSYIVTIFDKRKDYSITRKPEL